MNNQGTKIPQYSGNSGAPPTALSNTTTGSGSWMSSGADSFVFGDGAFYHCLAGTGSSFDVFQMTNFATGTPPRTISEKTKSLEQVEFETRKARLMAVVDGMRTSAPNWNGSLAVVNDVSAQSAQKFLRCLPGNAILPQVAPDGEGDIMFVWDGPTTPSCVVVVEKNALHLVSGIGTPEARQIDQQRFLGVRIPPIILDQIPSK
jgi:hypothetical protein